MDVWSLSYNHFSRVKINKVNVNKVNVTVNVNKVKRAGKIFPLADS